MQSIVYATGGYSVFRVLGICNFYPIIELMSMNALCNGPIVKTEKKATKKSSKHDTKLAN